MNSSHFCSLIIMFYLAQTLPLCSQTTLIGWDFEDQDLVADIATDGSGNLPDNVLKAISGNDGGTITFPGGNVPSSGEAMSTNNWSAGEGLNIFMNTANFSNLTLEFDARSSNSGPRDFAIFYSQNGEAGPFVPMQNTGFVSPTSFSANPMFDFELPVACSDIENLCLRVECLSDTNAAGNFGIGSSGTLRLDNIKVNSAFDNPLPVDMISFKAEAANQKVILQWITAAEINNRGFIVYRSKNRYGIFNIIDSYIMNATLKGAGNSSKKTEYKYIDNHLENNIKYWYKVADVDLNGTQNIHGPVSAIPFEETIEQKQSNIPREFHLWQNFPNPFNPETLIRLSIPEIKEQNEELLIEIYSVTGQKVRTLFEGRKTAGVHSFVWNGTDDAGKNLAGGIYYYRINSVWYQKTCKMILVR